MIRWSEERSGSGQSSPFDGHPSSGRSAPKAAIRCLFKPFVAAPVLPRLPLSFRRDLELQLLLGTRRMFGKMTVVVLAKTKKQPGAGIQPAGLN
jgi:hypothetical protein